MSKAAKILPKPFIAYSRKNIINNRIVNTLPKDMVNEILAVSTVFPFRTNNYVIEELIDWDNIPNDPIFQLTFPTRDMLEKNDFDRVNRLLNLNAPEKKLLETVRKIQEKLNPHPASQMEMNVPVEDGEMMRGIQHKYEETALFFPSQGQTCHAYCTYCFRWPQFVGIDKLKFASSNSEQLVNYLTKHPEVTDVLITGGDPLFMSSKLLRRYIEPLIKKKPGNLSSIRIGTKVPAYWPYRFITDKDSDDLLRLFEEVVNSGLHLAIMTHYSHPRELKPSIAQQALQQILKTGAVVRCQAPIIRHINDDPELWATLWKVQVKLGAIPYYMFIGRNTGPKNYFKVPLSEAYHIFTKAYSSVSGLCRTVRGPSMSCTAGKVLISGIADIRDKKVFILKFIQGRDPKWANRTFFAQYDDDACWINELKPAFGETEFFYEKQLLGMKAKQPHYK